ncbi:hypothetical protein C8R46DRAFT_1042171 [Mycena filopes]|nr:hypothetical protein C8R46DRAFT_1042171 [Mycena filopes]
MAPFPLLVRIAIDLTSSAKQFLLNAEPDEDFVATRDRSTKGGSVWSFKRCEDDLVDVDLASPIRNSLPRYFAFVFGQVELMVETERGYLVGLQCPDNATCRMQSAFNKQLEVLKDTLAIEAGRRCRRDLLRLVWLPTKYAYRTFVLHARVELSVGIYRTESVVPTGISQVYALHVRDFWRLRTIDTPAVGPGGASHLALAGAKYPDHLVAVRERGMGGGSLHIFKAIRETSPDLGASWPTEDQRGFLRNFQCVGFGEVAGVTEMENRLGIIIEVVCPANSSCSVMDLFHCQLQTLRSIIQGDTAEVSDATDIVSWVSSDGNAHPDDLVENGFTIYFMSEYVGHHEALVERFPVGQMFDAIMTLQRIVRGGELSYYLLAEHSSLLTPGDSTGRGEVYPFKSTRFTMTATFLERYRDLKEFAVGLLTYPGDIWPIRQQSVPGGSLFLFRNKRGSLNPYLGALFGEIGRVFPLEDKAGIVLQICLPDDASCAARLLYEQQLSVLQAIMDEPGVCVETGRCA